MNDSIIQFQYQNPTKVHFGVGVINSAGRILKQYGHRVLLVSGRRHAQESGLVGRLAEQCKQEKICLTVVSGVTSNPTLEWIRNMAASLNGICFDVIVAVGGGSVMDAAKVLSLARTNKDDLWEYRITGSLSVGAITKPLIPIVTVPTIAGTGCEISPAALVSGGQKKEIYFSPYMYPVATIVDPELAKSAPREQSAQTGMDAFVQALEAFVSVSSQPFSDMFAIRAMEIVVSALPNLLDDLDNIQLRTDMALASLLSCYAIGMAGVGAAHALSAPLSGKYNIPHGLGVSILLPRVMDINIRTSPLRYTQLAQILTKRDASTGRDAIDYVRRLLTKVGFSETRLSDFGITKSDCLTFAKDAYNPDMATNPGKLTEDEVVSIYQSIV